MSVKHTVRCRDGGTKEVSVVRSKAIKMMCTECLGWEADPASCTAPLCPLFPFRGKSLAAYHSSEKDVEESDIICLE